MSKELIEGLVEKALRSLPEEFNVPSERPNIMIETPKDKQHGDFSTNIALVLAKPLRRNPKVLALEIQKCLPENTSILKTEIAGPGFINFYLSKDALYQVVADILSLGKDFGLSKKRMGKKILLEFVSSNPTGPLHVGHGRHAAFGAVVANLLEAVGYDVYREYYVNDAGRQMDIVAVSVWLRYLELNGQTIIFPDNGYRGDYVSDVAKALQTKWKDQFIHPCETVYADLPLDESKGGDKELYIDALVARSKSILKNDYEKISEFSLDYLVGDMRQDLEEFGVLFDRWYAESELTKSDAVDRTIQILTQNNYVYEHEGALWFRATLFNDEKDRVLVRANGQRTYFANDVAYHLTKFERGFDEAIDIFGADHHGYIPRMKAAMTALNINAERLNYLIVQFVTLFRGGQQVQMSTRGGSFITLRELRKEVGNDAARFFYVMRKHEQPIDFDLDLAKSQSNENPVYYIQYAYARITSIFRQMDERGMKYDEKQGATHLNQLTHEHEIALLNRLRQYPEFISMAAEQREPSIVSQYLRELAACFHSYYNSCQFLVTEENLRQARLVLVSVTKQVIANGLGMLGVSAPETM